MSDQKFAMLDPKSLAAEDGVKELLSAPQMQPYRRFIQAAMQGEDVSPHLQAIAKVPLESRYVWRVASALKWGLADLDDWNVIADRETLTPEDAARLAQLLRFRPIQFCIFMKALFGTEEMERVMNHGIAIAKQEETPPAS